MTVTATNRKNTFSTNGVTTEFPFDFAITDISQVYAYTVLDGVETVYDNFTVTKNTSSEGGTLTTSDVLDDVDLLIFRDVSITQEVDYENGGRFPADSHEQAIDKLTLQNQDQQEEIDRTLKLSIASENSYEISDLEEGKLLGMVDSKIISVDATVEDADDLGELVAFGDEWAESDEPIVTTPNGMDVRSVSGANKDIDDAINRLDASATSELNAISLTLGIPYGNIMYSTDEFEILSYIFTQSDQSCYKVPVGAIGKFIESVVGDQLTTTDLQVYTMTEVSRVNVAGGDVTLEQTGAELQSIVSASMGVSGDGGNLTQTIEEVQDFIDAGSISVNLLKASQPIVQSVTGTTLPSTTPTNYTAGDEIAFGYKALTDITNLIVDAFGNLTLSDPDTDLGEVYFECDIPSNMSISDVYGYAVEGASENITTQFTSAGGVDGYTLTEVSGKALGAIDLTKNKAFTFSISEQSGGVNIDNDEDVRISASLAFSQGLSTVDLYAAGERAEDVTYYNTDPSPRTVAITTDLISAAAQLAISKNGTTYLNSTIGTSSFNKTLSAEFTVLPGESYSASTTGSIETWFETQGE